MSAPRCAPGSLSACDGSHTTQTTPARSTVASRRRPDSSCFRQGKPKDSGTPRKAPSGL
ncbi:hypothetical protein FQZ97_1274250 [compost metagenome]